MQRWANRVAVVTGASSGIGAAFVKYLANNGMITVGLARRKERVEKLKNDLNSERIHAVRCDIQNEENVVAAFKEIEAKFGPVAVLVNNAGIIRYSNILKEGNAQDMRDVIETNVLGVVLCTREAFRSMKHSPDGDGHVFLINSISGHRVPNIPSISINIYSPTKHAITALTEVYRQEFLNNETKIKITSISPGALKTEAISEEVAKLIGTKKLEADDVADALIYCLKTPPNVQIHELMIKPMGETF